MIEPNRHVAPQTGFQFTGDVTTGIENMELIRRFCPFNYQAAAFRDSIQRDQLSGTLDRRNPALASIRHFWKTPLVWSLSNTGSVTLPTG